MSLTNKGAVSFPASASNKYSYHGFKPLVYYQDLCREVITVKYNNNCMTHFVCHIVFIDYPFSSVTFRFFQLSLNLVIIDKYYGVYDKQKRVIYVIDRNRFSYKCLVGKNSFALYNVALSSIILRSSKVLHTSHSIEVIIEK